MVSLDVENLLKNLIGDRWGEKQLWLGVFFGLGVWDGDIFCEAEAIGSAYDSHLFLLGRLPVLWLR